MKLWEGLGYYSRARNLQKAAQEIVKLGNFPDTYEGLLALPGIGDYTASAIAAAAFGRSEPAVDGNVLRVVTRLTDCHDDILDAGTKRSIRAALSAVMPESGADVRIFNQAMMELGATLCGPNTAPQALSFRAPSTLGNSQSPASRPVLGRFRRAIFPSRISRKFLKPI